MKQKKTNCKYCNGGLEAKTTRREFCSNKCKVYWHRENQVVFNDLTKPKTAELKPPPQTNFTINTSDKIKELEEEFSHIIGTSPVAIQRKKFLQKQITNLKNTAK